MTIEEIMNRIKAIKGDYINGMITSDEMVEHLEDIVHDVEGNDGMSWSDDDNWEGSFEAVDFTQLEVN